MPSIAETTVELIQWVFPEHAGAPGQIHGGRMMQWIAQAGSMAAARVARGTVVLGAMDDLDFLHPVKVGQIAILRARVEYVGRSSLEVGVRVSRSWPSCRGAGRRATRARRFSPTCTSAATCGPSPARPSFPTRPGSGGGGRRRRYDASVGSSG